MANKRHFVPIEVKTKKRLTAKIYMFDFFFLVGAACFAMVTQNFVIPSLRVIYIIFVVLMGLYLTRNSSNNPGKHIFQSFWFYLRRPQTTYVPVETEKEIITLKGDNDNG